MFRRVRQVAAATAKLLSIYDRRSVWLRIKAIARVGHFCCFVCLLQKTDARSQQQTALPCSWLDSQVHE